jgi:regulatory Fis family protein
MRVLEHVGGNKSQAAEILGISRATIYQLLADAEAETEIAIHTLISFISFSVFPVFKSATSANSATFATLMDYTEPSREGLP